MEIKEKRILRGIVTLILVFGMLLNSTCTQARDREGIMEPTGCKSFSDMKKEYKKQVKAGEYGVFLPNRVSYANGKLKTKFGTKKALFLMSGSSSCADISAYIKNGDKIYYAYGFDGHPGFMISKDSKYVVDSLSGGEVTLYKYSKGSYKEVKYYSGDKKKQLKKWKKKYKMYEPKFKVYASWSDL